MLQGGDSPNTYKAQLATAALPPEETQYTQQRHYCPGSWGRYSPARQPGTYALNLQGSRCGLADMANHKSGSTDRITGIITLRAVSNF